MSNENALANINVTDFKKRVEEHVVNTFGSLIPEEQFAALVDAQITAFFESSVEMTLKEVHQSYGSNRRVMSAPVTPFKQMVWLKLIPMVTERLDEYMKRDNVTSAVNKVLDDLCAKPEFENPLVMTTQQLMIAMAGSLFQAHAEQATMNAKSSVRTALINSGMPDAAYRIT